MNKSRCGLLLIGLLVLIQGGAVFGAFNRDTDPNLIGYWKLDEGTGTTAFDSSGKGNNGMLSCTATGTLPVWTGGTVLGAVEFNGSNNWINIGTASIFNLTSQVTLATWVYPYRGPSSSTHEGYITKGDQTYTLKEGGTAGNVEMNVYNGGWHTATLTGVTSSMNNTWYHLAGTFDGANIKIFLNGALKATTAFAGTINSLPNNSLCLARDQDSSGRRYYQGRLDEVRIYNRALTDAEVATLIINPYAGNPTPADKATDLNRDNTVLGWTAGAGAVSHNVYFGTDAAAVGSATTASPLCVAKAQAGTTFSLGRLTLGATYYWRVDEVAADGTVTTGGVWQFTVEPDIYQLAAASITATASAYATGSEPIKTINGSGLGTGASADLHGTEPNTMWSTGATTQPVWIQYNFDRVYKLSQMLVWNYNAEFEELLGLGLQNVTVQISVDGTNFTKFDDFVFAQGDSAAGYKYNSTVNFGGVNAKAVKILANSNYGAAQYGLSEVRFLYIRAQATAPQPANNATGIAANTTLTWRPGRDVATHNIFMGTDPNVLTSAGTSATAGFSPTNLVLGTKYYWRVDEVNGADTLSSDVWSFTVLPYWAIDDMESYNDKDKRMYAAWVDGYDTTTNGALVGVNDSGTTGTFGSTTIFHGGRQSMPFAYGNKGYTTSEATRTFSAVQDWTLYGSKVLTVFFYGTAGNATNVPLYVKLTDQAGKTAKVAFGAGTGEDPIVLADPAWQTWSLPLSSFTGVDATKISSMTIGVGTGSAVGTLYIDDIRLVAAMPAAPITPTLVGWWKLDNDVKDSSGNNNNGTIVGAPTYVAAGKIGASMKFNGTADYINCGTPATLAITDTITLSAWVKPVTFANSAYQTFISKGDHAYCLAQTNGNLLQLSIYDGNWYSASSVAVTSAMNGLWHHVAGTYDGSVIRLYVDGAMAGSSLRTGVIGQDTFFVSIGTNSEYATSRLFNGELDDVRIHRGVLGTSDIKKLANP